MKIISHYSEVPGPVYSGDSVKGVTGRLVIGAAGGAPHFFMRIFTIEPGGHTPRHEHAWEHEILIHAGSGQVLQAGEWHDISAGGAVFISRSRDTSNS